MYTYTIIDATHYRVVGGNLNAVFVGIEADAIAKVAELEQKDFNLFLLKAKTKLNDGLNKIVTGTTTSLNNKYSISTELLSVTEKEYYAYIADNTTPTPMIDEWATANGRTKEAEVIEVGIVLDFLKKSGLIQPTISKKIKQTTTEADVHRIARVLQEIGGYREKSELINNYDKLIGVLSGGG